MRRRTLGIGLGAAAALAVGSLPVLLAARNEPTASLPPDRVSPAEHQQAIEALKPPKRQRPAIAILALNEGTEVSDFLSSYGVLAESGVADVTVVADRTDPIRLYPGGIRVETQTTTAQFDASIPMAPTTSSFPRWSRATIPPSSPGSRRSMAKGAKIVSICNGSLTLAAAGLLDGRRATGHWYSIQQLQAKQPTMQWVRDRRYVVDRGVATSTGITASIPLMMALVEAIGGRAEAEKLAKRLGVANWDARHSTRGFPAHLRAQENLRPQQAELLAARNRRHQDRRQASMKSRSGSWPMRYSRTELTRVITVGGTGGFVQSRRGLRLRPDAPAAAAGADTVLQPQSDAAGPVARPRAGANCLALRSLHRRPGCLDHGVSLARTVGAAGAELGRQSRRENSLPCCRFHIRQFDVTVEPGSMPGSDRLD